MKNGKTILVVEDSPTQADLLKSLLEREGYSVRVAANGREGLVAARARKPALILSDILMPLMDGYAFCKAVKSDKTLKDILVILVTQLSSPQDILQALECGADNFIRKPYDPKYLLSRITHSLMNRELRRLVEPHMGVEIELGGQRHFITAERQQILGLLFSTYEDAIHLNEKLGRSAQILQGLNGIAEALNRCQTEREVADQALEQAMKLPGVQAGWLLLREGKTGFRPAAARGLPPALEAEDALEGGCLCQRKLLEGELGHVTNILECERLQKTNGDTRGLRFHASIPLWSAGRTIGILNLVGEDQGLFSQEELALLYSVGNQVAMALERARLQEHLEREVEKRTEALKAEVGERKRAEEALGVSEARFLSVMQSANDAIVLADEKGTLIGWNRGAEATFGYTEEEVLNRPLTVLMPERYRDRHRHGLARLKATRESRIIGKVLELHGLRKDGTEFPLELSLCTWQVAGQRFFGGILRDITQRKRGEAHQATQLAVSQALAEAATLGEAAPRLLRAVCETMDWEMGGIWLVDPQAKVLRCHHLWHKPSANLEEFIAASRAITFARGIGMPGRVWAGGRPAWIPDVLIDPNFPRAPVAARSDLHSAFGIPIPVGGEVCGVFEFFSHEIREPDQDLLTMMADIGIKIGNFIQRKSLEEQFRQSHKMEAVGELAGGIAHDFNNMLTVVAGYSHMLLEGLGPDDPMSKTIAEIRKAGERAASLTRQLLAFSRRQVLEPKVLDLNALVANLGGMLRRLISEDINLKTVSGPDLGPVLADPGQLEQVLLNLVINARDAMPQGGELLIQTANVALDEPYAHSQVTVPPGAYVTLAVTDTGCGMDAKIQARIFEPFFTTKARGKGTGLGLATVYGIVKQSGGYILVDSEPGRGSIFTVYLPRVVGEADSSEAAQDRTELTSGSETILLVEDEDLVRTLGRTILQTKGYTVLEAKDGPEALRLSQDHPGPIHLLMTDMVMPGMSGQELADRLTGTRPQTKVLLISGYLDKFLPQEAEQGPARPFLRKPFTPAALVQKVREVLDTTKESSHQPPS